MTIQFRNNYFEDLRWVEVGAAAHSLYVLACDYADRKETNGIVPRAMLQRLSLDVESTEESTSRLLAAGLFRTAQRGNSVEIVGFLEDNIGFSAENKAKLREKWAADANRKRLHQQGIHSECNPRYCKSLQGESTSGRTGGASGGVKGGTTPRSTPRSSSTSLVNTNLVDSRRSLEETKMSIDEEGKANGARSTGSAGAPPVAGTAGSEGGANSANVYPGTNVQLADLDAELVDQTQPQLRVEPDAEGDRIYVATPDDDLSGKPPSLSAAFIRRANRHAAAEMTGWGAFQEDGSAAEDPAWILASAEPEVLAQYAKAFHSAPWG